MTLAPPRPRPPWLAAWLVELFASPEQTESILGDLHEEFSDVASKSGLVSARHWYWRQGVRTIFCLAGAAFRGAPWLIAGAVLFGFVLRTLGFSLPERIVVAILRAQRPYSNLHYNFYVWLVTWGIPIVRFVEMILIGCVVAAIAKGREVLTTMVLVIASSLFVGLNFFLWTHTRPQQIPFPWTFLLWNLENCVAILVGCILVRAIRSVLLRHHPTP